MTATLTLGTSPSPSFTVSLENACHAVALRAGAELACAAGTLWVTLENARRRPSPDIVLTAGQRHRVTEDATVFLTALGRGRAATCHVTPG